MKKIYVEIAETALFLSFAIFIEIPNIERAQVFILYLWHVDVDIPFLQLKKRHMLYKVLNGAAQAFVWLIAQLHYDCFAPATFQTLV